jgi:hypothetical protein
MASTIRVAATQHWAGKAPSLSKGKWLKRALGATLKRDRSKYRILKTHDHQPSLHCDQGGQRVQRKDDWHQSALADRLHLSQDHWLGVVLSQHDLRRLQPVLHLMETLHKHADTRRDRHIGLGFSGIGLRPSSCHPQASPAQRKRFKLRLGGAGGMVAGQGYEAQPWRALSPPNPR